MDQENTQSQGLLGQMKLLMWKNLLQMARKPVLSIAEIILPLLGALIMSLFRLWIIPKNYETPTAWEAVSLNASAAGELGVNTTLLYAPNTSLVNSLMADIYDTFTNENVKAKVLGFASETALQSYYVQNRTRSQQTPLAIVFDVSDSTSRWPTTVTYKIRPRVDLGEDWNTKHPSRISKVISFGDQSTVYYTSGFVYLQHLIGLAIIREWQPAPVFNVSMWLANKMPSPPYTEDMMFSIFGALYPNLMMMFVLISVVIMVRELILEKERKLKEYMKVMCVNETAIWMTWFLQFFLCLLLVSVTNVIFLCIGIGTRTSVLPQSDPSLIFVFFLCYNLCVIMYSFLITTLFSKAQTGGAIAGLVFSLTFDPIGFVETDDNTMTSKKLALCLFFNTAMGLGVKTIAHHETSGLGTRWSNVADVSGFHYILIMLLLDTFILAVLAWYINNVHPGEYGVSRPWYFPCQRSYWCGEQTQLSSPPGEMPDRSCDPTYFEREPLGLPAGIRILNLRKVFDKETVAVQDFTLTMFEGHITVLLGHNGAGKTTTMSMLTGFISPTSGTAYVNGYDIRSNIVSARRCLGMCPQHNIFFDSLTVEDHLKFFALLKGCRKEDVPSSVIRFATEVGLEDKLKAYANTLSGGQMRKLSIAIAFIGGSKIVILDEPSSGMDPVSRRQMWEMLQRNREGRTILLTTHYMDEADILGDRIAIMAEGVVKCCGTSMFLKKIYGAGYHLVIVKTPDCIVDDVTSAIQEKIESAQLEEEAGAELSYLLPIEESSKFVELFSMIESESETLGISSFGVTATTMEEVFLKVGVGIGGAHRQSSENVVASVVETTLDTIETGTLVDASRIPLREIELQKINPSTSGPSTSLSKTAPSVTRDTNFVALNWSYERLIYPHLHLTKFYGMFIKNAIKYRRHLILTLAVMVMIILLVVFVLVPKHEDKSESQPPLRMSLDVFTETVVAFTTGLTPSAHTTNLGKSYRSLFGQDETVHKADVDMKSYFLAQAVDLQPQDYVEKLIIGAEFLPVSESDDVQITAWYSGHPFHALPISLAYVINAFARATTGDTSRTINTFNHPLPADDEFKEVIDFLKGTMLGFSLASTMLFGMAILTSMSAYFAIKERQTGAKHVQIISGADPFSFWLSAYTWDYIFILIVNLLLLITLIAFQVDAILEGRNLAVLWLVMMLYSLAGLPYAYLLHFFFKVPATGFSVLLILKSITGLCTMIVSFVFHIPVLKIPNGDIVDNVCRILFPQFCFCSSVLWIFINKYTINFCKNVNVTACPETLNPCCKEHCQEICFPYEENYLSFRYPGVGGNLVCMMLQSLIFFALLIILELQVPQKLGYYLRTGRSDVGSTPADEDTDVRDERLRVSSGQAAADTLVLNNISKKYGNVLAVDHVFLGVSKQECFGLVGKNGAGKSTTFKLITGDVMLTSGDVFVQQHSVKTEFKQMKSSGRVGYCPQTNSLIGHMTGRETLYMFARLRGVPAASISPLVSSLLSAVFLSEYADVVFSNYSGGNKRKLCIAAALIGNPSIILLDEPTSGVDPAARRQLWTVLSDVRASGCTLVLTSHSMEECEALSTRLAIMVNGQFKCLGSPQHLKSKFSQGFLLKVKMAWVPEGYGAISQPLIHYVLNTFPGTEKLDDRDAYITFKVNDTRIPVSQLFFAMEQCKEANYIEDYSIFQTTLEEIFIALIHMQRPLC